jgi:hypothetical protein
MSNQTPKLKSKISLSKTSKRRAATIVDPHQRGAYIRSMLDAEKTASMSKFFKVPAKDKESN